MYNNKKVKDSKFTIREDLKKYLDQKIKIRGVVCKKIQAGRKGVRRSNKEFVMLLLKNMELVNQKEKLKDHMNIYFLTDAKHINLVEKGDEIVIEGYIRYYYSFKTIEGIPIKVKNYGIKEARILELYRYEVVEEVVEEVVYE